MASATLQLAIPVLLPEVKDERDQCVERLQELMRNHKGIEQVHIERDNGDAVLCIHYDPNLTPLDKVRRLAMDAGAQVRGRYAHELLDITGMDCADCALSIEHILRRTPGVLAAAVSYPTDKLRVEYDLHSASHKQIVSRIRAMGYGVTKGGEAQSRISRHRELLMAILSGVLLAVGYLIETFTPLPPGAAITLYALAYLSGGLNAARHGIEAALNLRFDVDFLMVVAAIGAAIQGEWAEGTLLLFLFSLGHALEHYAMDRARHAIETLGEITPKTARVRREGRESEIPVEELVIGDSVIVRPGERIAVDGKIIEGQSAIDQSPVTGESIPVEKETGDAVLAGTVNGDRALVVEVVKLAQDTTLARVIKLVEEAQTQQSPTQRFTDHFTRIFVPAVLVIVLLVIVIPPLLGVLSWSTAFLRALTLLVAASPCALALSTPSAVLAGIAQAARNGVLIKGGIHLENLGMVDAMALDKTGTITVGEPDITDVVPLDGVPRDELLRIAAAAESLSNHPLAQAVVRYVDGQQLRPAQVSDLKSLTGFGVEAQVEGQLIRIGNLKMFSTNGSTAPASVTQAVDALESAGKTTMIIQHGDRYLGVLGLADQPREAAAEILARLHQLGIKNLVMLTGDNQRVGASIARHVGLDDVRAGLLPEDKVTAINDLKRQHGEVAMVGDGVNDAPALANATVGIAMGAGGTDVALETADVALMGDDLSKLPFAVGLSRQSRRIIQQNLFISLVVVAVLIVASITGLASIGPAIVFHEGSTLLVVFNALRLLGYRSG